MTAARAEVTDTLVGPLQDLDLLRLMMGRSFEVVQKWESYGINVTAARCSRTVSLIEQIGRIGAGVHAAGIACGNNDSLRLKSDATSDIWQGVFQEKMENGSGPVFMNCAENTPEDTEFMMKSFYSEGDTSIVDYLQQYHIDLNQSMIEFGTYDYALCGPDISNRISIMF